MTDGRTRSSFHLPIPPARAHHGRMPRLALPLLTMLLTLSPVAMGAQAAPGATQVTIYRCVTANGSVVLRCSLDRLEAWGLSNSHRIGNWAAPEPLWSCAGSGACWAR